MASTRARVAIEARPEAFELDPLARTNHEATLLLVERLFGWVGDSAALVRALDGVGAARELSR